MTKVDRGADHTPVGFPFNDRLGMWAHALLLYYLTSLVVALGLSWGSDLVRPSHPRGHTFGYTNAVYANWDGQWYTEIAAAGYTFDPDTHSSVAFFPAYPLLGRLLATVSGLRYDQALLVTSNVLLAATFVLLAEYARARTAIGQLDLVCYAPLALGLVPTSFFFRVAYSESLFLFLTTLVFYGMRRRWPLILLAGVIGLTTASRAVGVALIPALAWHAWRRHPSLSAWAMRMAPLALIACWGLIGYMAYQALAFGEPLAFIKAQAHWQIRPPGTLGARLLDLVTFEPIRSLYNPFGPAYAETLGRSDNLLFCLRAADPLYFAGAASLVALGAARGWLTGDETIAAAGMLLIPYVTIGYEQYMQSMARSSSAVIPVYFVLGRLLSRVPTPIASALAGLSGFFLGAYSALFASWYLFV